MPSQKIRRCATCRKSESETAFYASQRSYCKRCWGEYESRRLRAKRASETSEQRELRLEQRRLKRHGRAERVRHQRTPEEKRALSLERARHYYWAHREERIAYQKARREADLEAARAYERGVYKRTSARHQATNRARERGMKPLNRNSLDYEAILRSDPCCYCGGLMEQIDHIEPVATGGENHWCNLTAACWPCNRAKSDKSLLVALA